MKNHISFLCIYVFIFGFKTRSHQRRHSYFICKLPHARGNERRDINWENFLIAFSLFDVLRWQQVIMTLKA